MQTISPTLRHADPEGGLQFLKSRVHNCGFAISKETMYWKHMTALGFSQKIGDTPPRESWYEDTWLSWDYKTNNADLEISEGYSHTISHAFPYDKHCLPEEIKEKYGY